MPFVTWQISRQYSIFVQIRTNMSHATTANSFLIHPRSSTRSPSNGGTKILSLIKLCKKKLQSPSCPEATLTTLHQDQFDLSNVVGNNYSHTFSRYVILEQVKIWMSPYRFFCKENWLIKLPFATSRKDV